jgi:hypothetical protein
MVRTIKHRVAVGVFFIFLLKGQNQICCSRAEGSENLNVTGRTHTLSYRYDGFFRYISSRNVTVYSLSPQPAPDMCLALLPA